ncbi:PREDICTED: eukaryotic translation initiation factor 3 subunit C [Rhagoletis zephyria]|uniref:eukaryotic translation initiation factor 3 subunit C n=2 Tax=Rhagoletis TaxID=28609 RepID=UPI000811A4A1|nr:PREDICTED: eukaryotic translation initiation factor 3 subunit C [Rhagoletis zephyria]XP_017476393.1 PREDICTED: eukaryotic translation initiation factor 3 subunit C [Rhagoletis zephyria]XP_036347769.1 LOW QUALITY PROTEIN: eukaryotic translation initiation factor 3 subunit C-like [Rhagoletis pomonella]
MSRFFATGSDSETESSDEEVPVQAFSKAPNFQFSDDEEEVKRVVRSTKEKRYENLTAIIKSIRNHKKIKDMASILSSFEDLTRAYTKALPVITKEEKGVTPRFYIRCLAELEDFINEVWEDREGRKNLSKNNSKSLGTLRQKVRKYIKDFEEDLTRFREAPDQESDAEEEEAYDSDQDKNDIGSEVLLRDLKQPSEPKSAKAAAPSKSADHDDDSDDSIDWGSDSESESESSDDENQYQNMRERFLKRPTGEREEKEDREDRKKEKRAKEAKLRRKRVEEDADEEGEWETVFPHTVEKPKMFDKDAEIDVPLTLQKLSEIMAARGKRRTDRRMQIELLFELRDIAEQHELGNAVAVKIHFSIISAIFDYNQKISEPMKLEHWSKLLDVMQSMMKILLANDDIRMSEEVQEENEEFSNPPYAIRGCSLAAVERLDDEFTKLLKECDPHTNDYVSRLKDEVVVTRIIESVLEYFERVGNNNERCRVYLRKIEHLYYKFDPEVLKKKRGELPPTTVTSVDIMDRLCKFIYTNDDTDRIRTRAILAHIYHHAMHDNWFQARDLVLMSHLQDTIDAADPSTRILYNRMMANLGLCAFRQENIKDAHHCLVDLMVTGKPKELLAQGLLPQRQHERSAEQEKIEKQRQMPFHMHINLELLECVYLVSAMLLEIPYIAAHEFDARRRMISKTFYQQLRSSERQSLVGPPESMREHVVAAAKAMRCGNWNACANFIVNKKMNTKVWDLFYEAERVRDMLVKFIKEESLRTYLFTYSNVYTSLSIPSLAQMYELPVQKVHSLISKMIINEELMASLDDPSETVVMHRSEPSRLQALAMQFVDKVTNLVDVNEKVFDMKQGNFFQRGNMGNRERGYNRNQNNQGGNWGGQRRDNRNQRNRNQRNQHHHNKQQHQQQQQQQHHDQQIQQQHIIEE